MANHARVALENALRAKRLDRTLTTALAPFESEAFPAATGITQLDRVLHGGFPHGQLSEVAGPPSSGRLTVALQAMAAATARGELVAYVDTFDRLDVASAAAAGVLLDRLLWIRGQAISRTEAVTDLRARTLDRALKALMLVLQAGGFGIVLLDLADVPMTALRRLPPPTWLRVQRAVEGRETACLLLTPEPLARSAGGLTLSLTARSTWSQAGQPDAGQSDTGQRDAAQRDAAQRARVMTGLALEGRVISPRRRINDGLSLTTRHVWASGVADTPIPAPARFDQAG